MDVFLFFGLLLTVVFVGCIPIISDFGNDTRPEKNEGRRKKWEGGLPIYERLARAEERAAEKRLDRGDTRKAREHFREAKRIRDEALEAMMNGEEPTI